MVKYGNYLAFSEYFSEKLFGLNGFTLKPQGIFFKTPSFAQKQAKNH